MRRPDLQPSTECLDSVSQTSKARTLFSIGAANSVIDDLDDELATASRDVHGRRRGASVLADVGQALRDHVVRRDLDRLGDATVQVDRHADWHRRVRGQRLEGDGQAVRTQHRRMQAAGDVAQLGQRDGHLVARLGQYGVGVRVVT